MESESEPESKNFPEKTSKKSRYSSQYTLAWQNISVWNKLKENQGIFQKTRYRDVQLLNNGEFFSFFIYSRDHLIDKT